MAKTPSKILDNSTAREYINNHLRTFAKSQIDQANEIHSDYEQLWNTIEKLLLLGGKRIRPYITLLTYQALTDKNPKQHVDIASAQELLHLALLIHDDIIDRDYIRYGIDNVSGQYQKIYQKSIKNESETKHYADSMAILAGDLLISSGYQMISNSKIDSTKKNNLFSVFSEAIFTVAGGELLDTESAFKSNPADALIIAKTKTAHYSFVTPLTIGAILADAEQETINNLKKFGYDLGMAYQLVDDMLGVFGDNLVTGKSNIGDIKEAKRTYLIDCFYSQASTEQKLEFDKYFGNKNLKKEDSISIIKLLIDSGAKSKTESKIIEFKNSALKHLESVPMSNEAKSSFVEITNNATNRTN